MNKLLLLNVVGLSPKHVGGSTPNLQALAEGGCQTHIHSMLPAVTCSVQATYFTGKAPTEHGIVGNGWYFKDLAEIKFWHQSNHLIQSPQIWTEIKKVQPEARTANLFCWYNMYNPADISVTVRPMYPADGRKIPDIYTHPPSLRAELNEKSGVFPLFNFWGPKANIASSEWIAGSTLSVLERFQPHLTVAYLPHLDYALQKYGPDHASIDSELKAIDSVCGKLIDEARINNYQVVVLSEYGIQAVNEVCYLNRLFRQKGWLTVREELGLELLDAGASKVFAVVDHQVAHIYVQDKGLYAKVMTLLEGVPEIAQLLGKQQKADFGLDHARSGDIVAIAKASAWFSYYYWLDDRCAPDFARTVDIHRKPGYDPAELFIDPVLSFPMVKILGKLARKKLGFRTLLDVIPLNATLVKGSHGALSESSQSGASFIASEKEWLTTEQIRQGLPATEVMQCLLKSFL